MSGKKFAQINCSLLRSKKFSDCNHLERWAYLCAHLTPLGGFAGQFRYPLAMWSLEAGLSVPELEAAINRLTQIGLIEYDNDEEILRIVGYHRQRPTENASRAIARVDDFEAMELENERCIEMWLNGVAEFIVAAVKRSQGWKADSPDLPKLREAMKGFMRRIHLELGDVFLAPLATEMEGAAKAVKGELVSLFPLLEGYNPTPCPHPENTVSRQREGEGEGEESHRDNDTDIEKDTDTCLSPEFSPTTDLLQVEGVEVLRSRTKPNGSTPTSGPRESTKRSAIAMGMKC